MRLISTDPTMPQPHPFWVVRRRSRVVSLGEGEPAPTKDKGGSHGIQYTHADVALTGKSAIVLNGYHELKYLELQKTVCINGISFTWHWYKKWHTSRDQKFMEPTST